MKSVLIVYNQANNERVEYMLDTLGIRGFTFWENVQGRGSGHDERDHSGANVPVRCGHDERDHSGANVPVRSGHDERDHSGANVPVRCGDPHRGTHTWPELNNAILTVIPDDKVDELLRSVRKLDKRNEEVGIRAFVWNIEQMV